jgi:hypothetical protein
MPGIQGGHLNDSRRLRQLAQLAALSMAVCCFHFAHAADEARIKRIIVAVSPGAKYRVAIAATGLGGIGGAANAQDTARKSEQINEKARELGVPNIGPTIAARLEKALEKKGYEIVREKHAKADGPSNDADADSEPESPRDDADAVLTVLLVSPGFLAMNPAAAYRPNIRALVKLRDPKSRAVLRSARIVYGQTYLPAGTTVLPVDPKYSYSSFDALLAKAGEAFEGYAKGAEPIAAAIAAEIPPAARAR